MAIVSGFQSGGSGDIKLITPPTIVNEETYIYDGTAKGPTITNVDTEHITITGTTSASEVGNYTITISLNDLLKMRWDSIYTNNPIIINYSIVLPIFGAEWDGSSSPAWSRTDGASNFTDPDPYYYGMSGTPSSPFDKISPWKDMRIVEDDDLGTLVEIPKFWYKWTTNGDAMKLQITAQATDGFLTSPAHADRGDGEGERDYVYVGRYHCDTNYKSTTGVVPKVGTTRAIARSAIKNLKTGAYQYDFAMYWTIAMLYLVEFAHWDSQSKIGYGRGDGSAKGNMGYTDNMPYHTGTTQISRTTYGLGMQYRYIEGLWDNVYDWCDGIYFAGNNRAYVYAINNPNEFSDTSNGTYIGIRASNGGTSGMSSGEIKSWTIPNVSGFEWARYTKEQVSNSNYNTYVCDYCSYYSQGVVLSVGGNYGQSQGSGLFYLNGYATASGYDASIGARLMYLPPNS